MCEMLGRNIRSESGFEQLCELCCRVEPDVERLDKLRFVRSRTVCMGERSIALHSVCGRHVLELVGVDELYELSSGIESDGDGINELLVLQWRTIFSGVGSDPLRCMCAG